MTDIDYTDALALLTDIPAQGKSLLLRLEQVVQCTGLNRNANKTKYTCSKKRETSAL